LLASVSLGAEQVSRVLIDAGADLETTSLFGARALHWAAWVGASATVGLLIENGAAIDARDTEFGATPLFWAAHGYGPNGPVKKNDQVGAAKLLMAAGANMAATNKHGVSVIALARTCARQDLHELLQRHV
jgi:methionine synthase I (cobalamin-dependent)